MPKPFSPTPRSKLQSKNLYSESLLTTAANEPRSDARRTPWGPLVLVASAILLLDQVTKFLAVRQLTTLMREHQATGLFEQLGLWLTVKSPGGRQAAEPLIDGFWSWTYAENPGAAWSFAAHWPDDVRVPFFHVVSAIAVGLITLFYRRLEPDQRMVRFALSLLMGGALGNLFDRLVRGYVIDFIDWHWNYRAHWPTFNVADVGITVGVALIFLDALWPTRGRVTSIAAADTPPDEVTT